MKRSFKFLIGLMLLSNHTLSQAIDFKDVESVLLEHWSNVTHSTEPISATLGPELIKFDNKEILLLGTEHERGKRTDSMFQIMSDTIDAFSPTVALTESYSNLRTDRNSVYTDDIRFFNEMIHNRRLPLYQWSSMSKLLQNADFTLREKTFLDLTLMLLSGNHTVISNFENYYTSLIQRLSTEGVLMSNHQNEVAYFYDLYRRHSNKYFNLHSIDFSVISPESKIHLNVARELNGIKLLAQLLEDHDRIVIQCGASHKESFRKAIQQLKQDWNFEKTNDTEFIDFKNQIDGNFNENIRSVYYGGKEILLVPQASLYDYNIDNFPPETIEFDSVEKYLEIFSPDFILTQNYFPVYSTKERTGKASGSNGICRYYAYQNGISTDSWVPLWVDIYESLSRENYKDSIIESNSILFQLLEIDRMMNMENFDNHEEIDKWVEDAMILRGFPFYSVGINTENPITDFYNEIRQNYSFSWPKFTAVSREYGMNAKRGHHQAAVDLSHIGSDGFIIIDHGIYRDIRRKYLDRLIDMAIQVTETHTRIAIQGESYYLEGLESFFVK